MSTLDAVAVPLPQETHPVGRLIRVARWFKRYFRATGKLFVIRASFWALNYIGIAMAAMHTNRAPPLILAMTPNPLVVSSVSHQMPFAVFFLVAVLRTMSPDPVNYLIGRRSIDFFKQNQGPRWLIRLAEWMGSQNKVLQLGALFLLTLVSVPSIPGGPNAYNAAGAAKIRLIWVMAVSFTAKAAWVVGLYTLGAFFDPLAFLQRF